MSWQTVPRANFWVLHAARVQAHHAVQWMARAARAYIPEQSKDGHTSLRWDHSFGGLVTQPLPDGSRLGLRLADFTLAFLDVHPHALALDGRTESEVRTWLGGHVAARNLLVGKLDAPAPYTIPDHVVARGARYSLDELAPAYDALRLWFSNAEVVVSAVRGRVVAQKLDAPPVSCWPHHFDMDCAVALPRGRTMGVGFSLGDEFCDEPYFYTSMWPEPRIPDLPLLPAMAHWHTFKFLAALAPAHKIMAAHHQGEYVERFLDVSVTTALDALR